MALGVNQTYKNYYTIRLGSLTTQHQIQSNRLTLFSNEVTDIASKINFFENQKVLSLATPDGTKLAINGKYFDLPVGFDAADSQTWGNEMKYTTPCQKQIFIYRKATDAEKNDASITKEKFNNEQYIKILYKDSNNDGTYDNADISDSRILSNKLMSGEFSFVYRDDTGKNQLLSYKDLSFVSEQQDKTAYQETVQNLEAERENINTMQKKVQSELQTTEVEINAIQGMMESTEKVLQKNTETFKWGA